MNNQQVTDSNTFVTMAQNNVPNWAVPPQQQQQVVPQQPQVVPQQQAYPPQYQQQQQQTAPAAYPPAANVPHTVTPPPSGGLAAQQQQQPPMIKGQHKNNRVAKMEDKVLVTRTADEETEDGRIRNKEAMAKTLIRLMDTV